MPPALTPRGPPVEGHLAISDSELILERAVSPICGCASLRLRFTAESGELLEATGACAQATRYLSDPIPITPRATVHGCAVSLETALDAAAELLKATKAPLMRGLTGLSVEVLQPAIHLAHQLAATLQVGHRGHVLSDVNDPAIGPQILAGRDAVWRGADGLILWNVVNEDRCPRHLADLRRPGEEALNHEVLELRTTEISEAIDVAGQIAAALKGQTQRARGDGCRVAEFVSQRQRTHLILADDIASEPGLVGVLHAAAAGCWPKLSMGKFPATDNSRGVAEVLAWQWGARGTMLVPLRSSPLDSNMTAAADSHFFSPSGGSEQVTWVGLPGTDVAASQFDLVLDLGLTSNAPATAEVSDSQPSISIGRHPAPTATVAIRIPGLDPRLRCTQLREDGVPLLLCGDPQQGLADPAVSLLEALLARLAEVPR